MAENYVEGTVVWVEDPKAEKVPFLNAKVVKIDDDTITVAVEDGKVPPTEKVYKKADVDKLPPLRNPKVLEGCDDLTTLSYLHEPAVLHNVNLRYDRNFIYTYSGIVLIAVNPFQQLPIYSRDVLEEYVGQSMGMLSPHIFAVAEEAFTALNRDNKNQAIIVSGESGAGKTETTKHVMRYLACVGKMNEGVVEDDEVDFASDAALFDNVKQRPRGQTVNEATEVEKQVLASNPVLEAFGNAKTLRNDNSSRFGKFIELQFSETKRLAGASIRTYLLEKSRVTFQAEGERTYHFFYQLCAGAYDDEREEFSIGKYSDYKMLMNSTCYSVPHVDDAVEYERTRKAMSVIGIKHEDQREITRTIAGLLHFMNIEIEQGASEEESKIDAESDPVKNTAKCWECDGTELAKWMTHKTITAGKEVYTKPLSVESALASRDALAKTVYHRLFLWLVQQINLSIDNEDRLAADYKPSKTIGILDIYGFECFDKNSFEQFCINYANEKLQQQFNLHVFKLEQEEYVREGIEWSFINFADNQPCVDLIEDKLGVLSLLDEESRLPKGSDANYCEKLYTQHSKHAFFEKPKMGGQEFGIKHYAGSVFYDTDGFLEKNKDAVVEELLGIMRGSGNEYIVKLFTESPLDSMVEVKAGKKKFITAGTQFKASLQSLMDTLYTSQPHYVRCIKPNNLRKANFFVAPSVRHQLRCGGVLETIRISCAGYPTRWIYADFQKRYRILAKPLKFVDPSDEAALKSETERIITTLIDDEDKYQFGKTKVFFRAGQLAYIERLRNEELARCALLLQKNYRRHRVQRIFRATRNAVVIMQKMARGMLARKLYLHMRRTHGQIVIRKYYSRFIAYRAYKRSYNAITTLQRVTRGMFGRSIARQRRREKASLYIQTIWRGCKARGEFHRDMTNILRIQCRWRVRVAKRVFFALKKEARSVDGLKQQSMKMEMKVVELKRSLDQEVQRRIKAEERVAELEAAQSQSQAAVEASQVKEQAKAEQRERAQSEMASEMRGEIEDLQKTAQEAKALKAEKSEMQSKLDELSVKVAELQAQLEAKSQEVTAAQTDAQQARQDLQRMMSGGGAGGQARPGPGYGPGTPTGGSVPRPAGVATSTTSTATGPMTPTTGGPATPVNQAGRVANQDRRTKRGASVEATGSRSPGIVRDAVIEGGVPGSASDGQMASLPPLPCTQRDEDRLVQLTVLKLKPKDVDYRPVVASVLFRCMLHQAQAEDPVHTLLAAVTRHIRQIAQRHQNDREVLAYWLSNTTLLLHLMKRQGTGIDQENEFRPVLNEAVEQMYNSILRGLKQDLLPMLVPALLHQESNLGSGMPQKKSAGLSISSLLHRNATVADATRIMYDVLEILQRNCVAPSIVNQLYRQLFYFIDAHVMNKILLRKDLCTWSRGMQIKYNLSQLEQWTINNGLSHSLLDQFRHVRDAACLLLLNNAALNQDITLIYDACPNLNTLQLKQILSIYVPDEFEASIDTAVVQGISASNDGKQPSLLLDASVTEQFQMFDEQVEHEEYEILATLPVPKTLGPKLSFLVTPR